MEKYLNKKPEKCRIGKWILSICLLMIIPSCLAQYGSSQHVYRITLLNGNKDSLLNKRDIASQFNFDSIGVRWNMKSENDYLRFKILHFYILNGRKEGEHWKKKYKEGIDLLNEDFNKDMGRYLKKRSIKISNGFKDTPTRLIVYFVDKSENVQQEQYVAYFQFIDAVSGKTIALYYIEEDQKKVKEWSVAQSKEMQMRDLSFMMARYFKKHLRS